MKLTWIASLLSLLLLLCRPLCTLRILPRFYNSDMCLVGGSFLTFRDVTFNDCVYECYVRSRCVYLSYHWFMHGCFLHDNGGLILSENEVAISGCLSLNESNINRIGPIVAGHCAERPCSRSTKCVQSSANRKYGYACAVANCERPDVVENALLRNSMVKIGESVRFFCLEGYTMVGLPEVQCLENGNWLYSKFRCFKNYPVPVLQNADIMYLSTFRLVENSTVIFKCHSGYYNVTDLQTTCASNIEWVDLANLRCLKHCPSPPYLERATYTRDEEPYTIYSTAIYTCTAGYYMYPTDLQESTISCQDNGEWAQLTTSCYKYCGDLPSISHADIVERPSSPYTVGSVVKFQCDWAWAYKRKHEGVATVKCNQDGNWVPAVQCKLCILGIC